MRIYYKWVEKRLELIFFLNQCRAVRTRKQGWEWPFIMCLPCARSWSKYFNIKCSSVQDFKLLVLRLDCPSLNQSFYTVTGIQRGEVRKAASSVLVWQWGLSQLAVHYVLFHLILWSKQCCHCAHEETESGVAEVTCIQFSKASYRGRMKNQGSVGILIKPLTRSYCPRPPGKSVLTLTFLSLGKLSKDPFQQSTFLKSPFCNG